MILIIVAVIIGSALASGDSNGYFNRTIGPERTINRNYCVTSAGFTGVCMTRFRCGQEGGTQAIGSCGAMEICCETNMQCGKTSSLKKTLIQNPTSLPTKCAYTFRRYSSNVWQIKVEMEEFRLQQPLTADNGATAGDTIQCLEYLEVNGMTLCGNNDGQHVYVPFGISGGLSLTFTLAPGSVARWRLVVTQLECPSVKTHKGLPATQPDVKNILAPRGCTQFFTERSGTFESFNYNGGVGPYMANLNYAICFQRQVGDSGMQFSFINFLLPNQLTAYNGYDTDCHPLIVTVGKQDDWLMISRSTVSSSLQPTYFCGTKVGISVTSGPEGPFVIYFHSDQEWTAEDIGFQIRFNIV